MDIPTFTCELFRVRGLSNEVRFLCPHCKKFHYHGVPVEDMGKRTHRISHCVKPRSPFSKTGYFIETPG